VPAGPRSEIGARRAAVLLTALEHPDVRDRWIGMIRAAASEPEAARMLRGTIGPTLQRYLVGSLDGS